ncbi:DUF262 domain-containing protein [Pseudomonas sp. 008]|uniref:GmrSD restriction endonuclease domain-containing protein n=1 Tax=Pseudomonas sp. 008 TaxID=2803906 RepID=UPI001A5CF00E|nr:DUF262 domain-containing protein [Pseudomonas sp. 008]GID03219.1 hypothetical protein TMM008_04210 [Pseudomonas sp. 008]
MTNDQPDSLVNTILLQPDNHNKKYESLFVEIDTGQIKLPMFQREFVWEKEQSARLIDSILKGFPIGTFIFWKTKEDLRSYKEVGNHKLPETPKGDYVQYILDGQQRITSLYAIRKGIRISKDGKEINYQDIYIDLSGALDGDDSIVKTEKGLAEDEAFISVHRLLTCKFTDIMREFSAPQLERIEYYKNRLVNYDFSTITIKDYPIEVACEIFSRINTGGKALTVFEVMVAKTYDEAKEFDLAERYEILRDGSEDEKSCLRAAKFETLPESLIMQCVAAISKRAVRGRDILSIKRDDFILSWKPMTSSLFTAIDFIRSELRVPVSQLLPYPALLIPLTYYFHRTKNKKPNILQSRLLEQFFYWVGLTERYGSSSDSKISEDFNKIDAIISENMPDYPKTDMLISKEDIASTYFSSGNSYCKSILCMLAFNQPKSFDTNGVVILDNSNLKIASSRNYHHFFPTKYLVDNAPGVEPNLIANITLIDGYSNKHKISKKPPSVYISGFSDDNELLGQTLGSHLIFDREEYGVDADNYELFIDKRSEAIANALNVKLLSVDIERGSVIRALPTYVNS